MKTESIVTRSPEETRRLAGDLLARFPGRVLFALHGELGSGKTCFVQGLALALDIRKPVTSPTFILINEYHGTRALYHIDLYRIRNPDEALGIGLEDYLDAEAVVAIEWAERAGDLVPAAAVHLQFERLPAPDERTITVACPNGPAR